MLRADRHSLDQHSAPLAKSRPAWRLALVATLLAFLLVAAERNHAAAQSVEGRLLRVTVSPGREVTVEWRATPGNPGDWVSVVRAGTPDDVYEATWVYTDGRPAGIYTPGRLDPGDYEARIYFDWPRGGYTVVERLPFRVGAPAVNVAESAHLVVALAANGELLVTWRNTPGNATDWVSVVRAGTPDDVYEATWVYTEGKATGSYNAGQLPPGDYEARLYLDWPAGGYLVVDRAAFRIGGAPPAPAPAPAPAPPPAPAPAPNPPPAPPPAAGVFESTLLRVTVTPARQVTVEWRGTPGSSSDWVSVVRAGTPDDVYEATWAYTGGLASGQYQAGQLPPGLYEARVYFNWPAGGYIVRDRVRFTVP